MAEVSILALGSLKNQIPDEQKVELPSEAVSAFTFVEQNFGIPKNEARMAFIINGRMQNGTYILQPNDHIKVLKMGGAG